MTAAEQLPVPDPVLRRDRLDYTPTTRSVPLCRHRAARLVTEWGHPDLTDDVALLASELATNALLHGSLRGRLFRAEFTLTATAFRIEVSDPRGERLPSPREAGADDCYGRGLMVVAQLADRWGVEPRTVGKTVFAEVALRGSDMPVGPHILRAGPPQTRTAEAVSPR